MAITWPDYLPEIDGERRFKGTRVTPWVLLHFYNAQGYSAEMLASEFPSVDLAVIHKFLAFYIENGSEMDALARTEEGEAERLGAASPNRLTLAELQKRRTKSKPISA